jgi:putative ABC transport system permease protein
VGTAPRVGDTLEPVVVVDAQKFADAGGAAAPNTVWAVGPGAASALRTAVGSTGSVVVYADTLAARRAAPLVQGLTRLALASSVLLVLFAVLSVVMAAASEAEPRAESVGRLRSLGLRDGQLWGLLAGELLLPVLTALLAGLVLGLSAASAMFGQLSLERITGQVGPPDISVSPWTLLSAAVLVATVLVLTHLEWSRLRRVPLGELLRGGPPR